MQTIHGNQFPNEIAERTKLLGGYYMKYYTNNGSKRSDDALQTNNYSIEI